MQIKLLIILLFPFAFLAQPNLTIDKKYYKITYSQKLKQPLTVDYGIRTRECTATRSGMSCPPRQRAAVSASMSNVEADRPQPSLITSKLLKVSIGPSFLPPRPHLALISGLLGKKK